MNLEIKKRIGDEVVTLYKAADSPFTFYRATAPENEEIDYRDFIDNDEQEDLAHNENVQHALNDITDIVHKLSAF